MTLRFTRRTALQLGTAAGLGYLFTGPAASVVRAVGSNGRLYFGGIGVGGKGKSDISHAGEFGEVIALCDIDNSERGLGWAAKKWKSAKTFNDYRKLYDDKEIAKTLDAVVVSTADHHHALASILGMKLGKHIYCQKPLTRTVFEARMMKDYAKQNKVITQMGNQGSALPGMRRAVEMLQGGIIGPVKEVHIWTDRPREFWKQSPDVTKRPMGKHDVPKNISWAEFLGGAPDRPYAPGYTPFLWRGFWEFGTGAIGDMACHTANMAFRALKLKHPSTISAVSGEVNPETAPAWAHVTMTFPERDKLNPALKLHWYEGSKDGKKVTPPEALVQTALKLDTNENRKKNLVGSGSLFVGEKGVLYSPDDYGAQCYVTEDLKMKNMTTPETLPFLKGDNDLNNKKEWVEAIKANKPEMAYANFDYSSLLTEAFLLGNVALRSGKTIEWDGPNMKVTNAPDAMRFVKAEYRKGWEVTETM